VTIARTIAVVIFAAGLMLGGAAPPAAPSAPPVRGGYLVLRGDFHVHSFPGDGALLPRDLAIEARRRRLDVIALTNHNAMISWRVAERLSWTRGGDDLLVLPGDEVTGVRFHMAAVGLSRPVSWRGSPAPIIAEVHAQHGVAIAAHPAGTVAEAYDSAAIRALDGVEAAHPGMHEDKKIRREFQAFYARAVRQHPGIAAIGSSDFHTLAPIGFCRTFLFVRERSAAGVLEAIRSGRTVACDGGGETYGPASLAALVAGDCRADAGAEPADATRVTRAGALLAWLALLALVVLGPGGR